MKKTISLAALAISASTSSFAFMGPPAQMEMKTYCLDMYTLDTGENMAGSCDQSANNAELGRELGSNDCAMGQVSLTTSRFSSDRDFPIVIHSCMPPNAAQL